MYERQNITVSFARETLKKAKVIAASQDTSVSEILRNLLEDYVRQHDSYERARDSYLAILRDKKGYRLGTDGQATWKRGDLHERA
ncbi:MAG TPA: CopG family transcriptional regulator [Firmicutes bacterium]|nr:CopG family transcriptional regulator [Candidatus Fermentithermobacillaceae bacterium]